MRVLVSAQALGMVSRIYHTTSEKGSLLLRHACIGAPRHQVHGGLGQNNDVTEDTYIDPTIAHAS
jgi:hypothetical protein